MPGRPKISAFIICKNEERNIRRCLDSVKWCDELIVIDSGSTDETLSICREYTDKIHVRNWPGYVEQKRYGLSVCTEEWVLNIDADEEVSAELRDNIIEAISDRREWARDINGYQLNRVVFYLGRWWRKGGWHPEYRLRLVRRSAASWGGVDPHERAEVQGRTSKMRGELRHYTYTDIAAHIHSLNSLSSVAARSMFEQGQKASALKVMFNPVLRFLKFYVLRRGFLEGYAGVVVAHLEAYYVFLKYVKLWELHRKSKEGMSAR